MIPRSVELRVIDAGLITGTAQWCNIKWMPHFLAMMDYERGGRRWNERQLTYIAALHGSVQKSVLANDNRSRGCEEKDRVAIEALVQDRIRQYRAASSEPVANTTTSNLTSRAPAAKGGPPISSMIGLFPAARIDKMVATVRDNIHRLTLADGSAVPRESEAERAEPLVPPEVERRAVDAGMVTGVTEWCRVDAHMHYTTMMAWERGQRRWSEKQLAYIGGLHDAAKSAIMGSREGYICDPAGRAKLSDSLMIRIQQYRTATPQS